MGKEAEALFVYGTLMYGESHQHLLSDVFERKPAWTSGRLYLLRPGYPALVDAGQGRVHGEVSWLAGLARALPRLDDYEGVDAADPARSLYRREVRPVHTADGRTVQAHVYVMDAAREPALLAEGAILLAGGRWSRHPRNSTCSGAF